jgi:hypothetical protein
MVLMTVRDQDCVDFFVCDRLEIRQRILAIVFRMHSAIEHQPVAADLDVVRVRADLGAAGEVNEFQMRLSLARCRNFITEPIL